MDRGAWWATVQGVAKSLTWLNRNTIHDLKKKKKNKLVLKTEFDVFGFFEIFVSWASFWKVRVYSDLGFLFLG